MVTSDQLSHDIIYQSLNLSLNLNINTHLDVIPERMPIAITSI